MRRFALILTLAWAAAACAAGLSGTPSPTVDSPASRPRPANDFGIFSFPPREEKAWQALADLGVGWVRLQFRLGEEDAREYRRVFDEGYGLWLTLYHRDPDNVADPDLLARSERGGFPPRDPAAYQERVEATVRPLVEDLRAQGKEPADWLVIQLGNETLPSDVLPDQPARFWHGTSDEYLETLRLTYRAVKSVDPAVPVALSGISSESMEAILAYERGGAEEAAAIVAWNERLLREGRADWADVHLYHAVESVSAKVAWVRARWQGPLAATEVGGPDQAAGQAYSEDLHAQDLRRRVRAALEAGVARLFWTTLVEQPAFGERYNPMALIAADWSRREAFEVYQGVIEDGRAP